MSLLFAENIYFTDFASFIEVVSGVSLAFTGIDIVQSFFAKKLYFEFIPKIIITLNSERKRIRSGFLKYINEDLINNYLDYENEAVRTEINNIANLIDQEFLAIRGRLNTRATDYYQSIENKFGKMLTRGLYFFTSLYFLSLLIIVGFEKNPEVTFNWFSLVCNFQIIFFSLAIILIIGSIANWKWVKTYLGKFGIRRAFFLFLYIAGLSYLTSSQHLWLISTPLNKFWVLIGCVFMFVFPFIALYIRYRIDIPYFIRKEMFNAINNIYDKATFIGKETMSEIQEDLLYKIRGSEDTTETLGQIIHHLQEYKKRNPEYSFIGNYNKPNHYFVMVFKN